MIIDSHIHYSLPRTCEEVLEALEMTGCEYGNLVAQLSKTRASETLDCLCAKYLSKGKLYTYGSLDVTEYYKMNELGKKQAEHVEKLMACGCDGIKMLEGKPEERKKFPIPDFDSPEFDAYFEYMEKNRIPIVWHINDPEEFWDINKVPEWALRSGWFYDDSFVNNEKQYTQVENVLKKHPNLVVTFAHFYFLSAQLDRLGEMFDKYPNVCVDMAPGIELFENLSKNIEVSRKFFEKYQDRIIYGTDICRLEETPDNDFNLKDTIIRGKLCQEFIVKDKVYIPGDEKSLLGKDDLNLNGLNLPKEIADKIFYKNFLRITGKPKEINVDEVLNEIEREKDRVKFLSSFNNEKCNLSYLETIENIFKTK